MPTKVVFKGMKLVFIGDINVGGALATEEAYRDFKPSYAYLDSEGVITRFDKVIGKRDDIKMPPHPTN